METNDIQVLQVLSHKKGQTSARVAERLGLTPFQITARLKSMENRGLAKRTDGKDWIRLLTVEDAKKMQEQNKRTATESRRTIAVDTDEATLRRDAKAPIIKHAKGWSYRYFWSSGNNRVLVFTTPNGKGHYTYAEPSEAADLLIDYRDKSIGMIRMKKFNKSSIVYRRLDRERGRDLESQGYPS